MPIYEFKCRECGKVWETFTRSMETSKISCPSCGNTIVDRLFSVSHVIKSGASASGATCCGRTERCETPSCSTEAGCTRR